MSWDKLCRQWGGARDAYVRSEHMAKLAEQSRAEGNHAQAEHLLKMSKEAKKEEIAAKKAEIAQKKNRPALGGFAARGKGFITLAPGHEKIK